MTASEVGDTPVSGTSAGADSALGSAAAAISAVSLGYALQLNFGTFIPEAMKYLWVAWGAALLAASGTRWKHAERWSAVSLPWLLGAGLAFELFQLLTTFPGIFLRLSSPTQLVPFYFALVAGGVVAGQALSERPLLGRWSTPLFLVAFVWVGAWMIRMSPDPRIDVFVFQRDAALELLSGRNPYSMTFVDILRDPNIYAPGLMKDGRLLFGFPYPPVVLLLDTLGHWLTGDYRYALLFATAAAAGLAAYAVPGRAPLAAAALFLFTPRILFVLEQGWSDPVPLLLLSATVFCACRLPRALPYVLGAFLVSKQFAVVAAPAAALLLPGPLTRRESQAFLVKVALTGAALILPFFLLDPSGFWHSVVALQFKQPFRADSLSLPAWLWHFKESGPAPLPTWLSFAALLPVGALVVWRGSRTPAGFAAGASALFVTFFALNKQAFCNYYFFVVGSLCLTVAAGPPFPTSATDVASPPRGESAPSL